MGDLEKLFYEFRGDLQMSNYESATQRIFPPDLMKLIRGRTRNLLDSI